MGAHSRYWMERRCRCVLSAKVVWGICKSGKKAIDSFGIALFVSTPIRSDTKKENKSSMIRRLVIPFHTLRIQKRMEKALGDLRITAAEECAKNVTKHCRQPEDCASGEEKALAECVRVRRTLG